MNVHGPKCHTHGISGYGNPDGKVMIVGTAPGNTEERTGRPFSGASGDLMDALLRSSGWSRDRVYTTNLVCYRPRDAKGSDRDPIESEIDSDRTRLRDEIHDFKPKLIIPIGAIAAHTFHSFTECGDRCKHTAGQYRGAVLWSELFSAYIMSTWHPAAVLRGANNFLHDIARDFNKIKYVVPSKTNNGQGWERPTDVITHIIQSKAEAQSILNTISRLPSGTPVALDIETGSKELDEIDVYVEPLLCFSVSWDGINSYVFPSDYARGLDWSCCERAGTDWLFWNGPSDTSGLLTYLGVNLPIKLDAMIENYALDERAGIHRLKSCAREFAQAGFYEESLAEARRKWELTEVQKLRENVKSETGHVGAKFFSATHKARLKQIKAAGFEVVPPDILYPYNAKDSAYTWRNHQWYTPRMSREGVDVPYKGLMLPALNAFRDINLEGVHIDLKQLGTLGSKWIPLRDEIAERMVDIAHESGWRGELNLNSAPQKAKLVYDVLGMPVGYEGRSTKEDVIEKFVGLHKLFDEWQSFIHVNHNLSQYILPMPRHIKSDGRLHPDVGLHYTTTGRLAYRRPPLQQIPKYVEVEGDDASELRLLFDASDDEHVICEMDYERIELWIAAINSGDNVMMADLLSGDFHGRVAQDIFNVDFSKITTPSGKGSIDYYRRESKYVTFGIMFGRGAAALARGELKEATNGSATVAQKYIDRWFGRYSIYQSYMERLKAQAIKDGYLSSITNRRRRFRIVLDFHALNQAINFPVQGPASDVCLDSLIECHNTWKQQPRLDSHVRLSIHDCIVSELGLEHIQESLESQYQIMTAPRLKQFGLDLPSIPVDVKVGRSWGTAKSWERIGEGKWQPKMKKAA